MSKTTTTKKETSQSATSNENKIEKYCAEFTRWLDILQIYHNKRFDKNYRQYTGNPATEGTHAKIADPLAAELVERVVQRYFDREPAFYALARGKAVPRDVSDVITNVINYFWNNQDRVQSSGPMRPKLKLAGRSE